MLQNLRRFFNITFKIEECHDDVYNESSSDEEEEKDKSKDSDMDDEEGEDEKSEGNNKSELNKEEDNASKPTFNSSFIYSCIGIGLQNYARKIE